MKIIDDGSIKEITPEIIAEVFAGMKSDEQARFFNRIDEVTAGWDGSFAMQLQYVTDDTGLTKGGRDVMRVIGEYSASSDVQTVEISPGTLEALERLTPNLK